MFLRRVSKYKLNKMCNRVLSEKAISSDAQTLEMNKRAKKTLEKIDLYLKTLPVPSKRIDKIPEKYLHIKQKDCVAFLYLLDDSIAAKVLWYMEKTLGDLENKIICDTNAGFGLITKRLLNKKAKVRVYESCGEFREILKEICKSNINRTNLFNKDLFHLSTMSYIDKMDQGHRVEELLTGIPKKDWQSDPAITVVGPLPKTNFILYLVRMLVHQAEIIKHGRVEVFALMRYNNYLKLTASNKMSCAYYTAFSIIFQLFFDYKFFESFDRKSFIPYETKGKDTKNKTMNDEEMCLVYMCLKKELPVPKRLLLPLYYFIRQGYGRGRKRIVPTLEKWIPDCGIYLLSSSSLKKAQIRLSIFTEFRELMPKEILLVFLEMVQHPNYKNSPFIDLMEADLLKKETIETDSFQETDNKGEKKTIEDISLY